METIPVYGLWIKRRFSGNLQRVLHMVINRVWEVG